MLKAGAATNLIAISGISACSGIGGAIEPAPMGSPHRRTSANPEAFLMPKEGAYLVGVSVTTLYRRLRGPDPPPFKRRGKLILLPRAAFIEWASQDVID